MGGIRDVSPFPAFSNLVEVLDRKFQPACDRWGQFSIESAATMDESARERLQVSKTIVRLYALVQRKNANSFPRYEEEGPDGDIDALDLLD